MIFRQALDAGDLSRVRTLAAAMPRIGLEDALRICLLMRDHDGYERAAVRWLGRFALEARTASIEDVQAAAAALDALPDRPDSAMERLAIVCSQCGVAG
ncbi:hypothetical protein Q5424_27935 [Conexibacter sp. JD483]|uniref:hypothetical protein n=1 Tax=unclassified Conexibacter TaxID=2627773 RepID=UPI002727479C|nr:MULTISPECIES: hypothetical protein [unclassified Conexibacter]MDO8186355.1 hypothetical protein [Conexibacter sp. CPCC 205706]MDO8199754.1 hypothetical protein [Conexibacter sp. CPCC 205762]MDR9372962.1 hypothetical protein [Conexibacter sp. JD483]